MKIKKTLPVLCMAFGLAMAVPMVTQATGSTTTATEQKESSGWHYDTAKRRWYYIKSDGQRATGFYSVSQDSTKLLYYFGSDGYKKQYKKGRVLIDGKYYYSRGEAGNYSFVTSAWCGEGNVLRAKADGSLYTNTVVKMRTTSGIKYYGFGPKGWIWGKGRHHLNGYMYYASSDKSLVRSKWQKIGTRYYYFDTNGRATGQSKLTTNGTTYFYRVDTSKTTLPIYKNGWYTDSVTKKTYYATSPRGRLATGFKTIDGKLYYFSKASGVLAKNMWIRLGGKIYRANTKGVVYTNCWFTVNSKRFYAGADGARKVGLQTISGKVYYISSANGAITGWKTIGKNRYYFSPSANGAARTGWFNVGGKTYYAKDSGVLATGFVIYNNSRYYLDPNDGGAMVKSCTKTINGTKYTFDSQGRQQGWTLTGSYSIRVNRQQNVVTVYKGTVPVKAFLCSTGLNNATPTGTFTILDKLPIHELNGPTWGYYCSHITSDILFHSLPGSAPSHYAFPAHKYNLLGQQASQGCIRLRMGDAYWIYKYCPIGTKVTIYDSSDPGPLGKPVYKTIPESLTVDPTDPTDTRNSSWA